MNPVAGIIIGGIGVGLVIQFSYSVASALSLMPQFWLLLIGTVLTSLGSVLIKD